MTKKLRLLIRLLALGLMLFTHEVLIAATDSYRYAHVTIDTPWNIFLFLLVIILFPFILMAVLHWYFAYKKKEEDVEQAAVSAKDADDRPAG